MAPNAGMMAPLDPSISGGPVWAPNLGVPSTDTPAAVGSLTGQSPGQGGGAPTAGGGGQPGWGPSILAGLGGGVSGWTGGEPPGQATQPPNVMPTIDQAAGSKISLPSGPAADTTGPGFGGEIPPPTQSSSILDALGAMTPDTQFTRDIKTMATGGAGQPTGPIADALNWEKQALTNTARHIRSYFTETPATAREAVKSGKPLEFEGQPSSYEGDVEGMPGEKKPAAPAAEAPKPAVPARPGKGDTTITIPGGYFSTVDKAEGRGINPRSSAFGPGQFIDSTFRDYMKTEHPEIDTSKMTHAQLNEYKNIYGQDATTWYASQNAPKLANANIPVTNGSLYGAHFLGPEGAIALYTAPPNTPVAQLLDKKAIAANPEVLAGKTNTQVISWLEAKNHVVPQQPMMEEPPSQAPYPTSDFNRVRQLMGGTNVSSQEHTANVLAGLAGGAGSVQANAPGSFAAALAAAGAGGGKGYAQSFASQRSARQAQAETETKLLSLEHQQVKENAEIANQNSMNLWKVRQQNADRQYENQKEEFKFLQPKIDTTGGITTISRYNPQTGNWEVTTHDSKAGAAQGEKTKQILEAMEASGPVAENYGLQAIMNQYPATAEGQARAKSDIINYSVGRIVKGGSGRAVFKGAYDKYEKEAQKEIESSLPAGGAQSLAATKPQQYQEMLQERIIAKILADPKTAALSWTKDGRVYSPAAGFLADSFLAKPKAAPAPEPMNAY